MSRLISASDLEPPVANTATSDPKERAKQEEEKKLAKKDVGPVLLPIVKRVEQVAKER